MNKARGEGHPKAKLKAAEIPILRTELRTGRHGIVAKLAREKGVHWTTMRDLRDGSTWQSVPE